MRRILPVTVLCAVLFSGVAQAQGLSVEEVQATIRERAAANGVSGDAMVRLAQCESRFSLTAIGRAGEIGLYQLHPQGLLRDFYAQGYTDPGSAYQQADYTAAAIARGLSGHWTCWRRT